MEENKLWFELKATCPYAAWQNGMTLIVSMFDADGTMISYLTTDDIPPSHDAGDAKRCHPRLRMISRDDIANNMRVRSIEFDLVATTFQTLTSSLSEFGRLGGQINMLIGRKTDDCPANVHDFPLKWLGNKNAAIVGCLVRNTSIEITTADRERIEKQQRSHVKGKGLSSDTLNYWFFRYSTAVSVSNSSPDLLGLFREETKQNQILMAHQAYSGCIPLSQFLAAGRRVALQNPLAAPSDFTPTPTTFTAGQFTDEAWQLESDRLKESGAAKVAALQNAPAQMTKLLSDRNHRNGLDKWSIASLPFDKISFMLNYLNQRMDLQDKNLADFWKVINFVKLEADFNDDQLAIVGTLAQRLEDYEHLLIQMYTNTAQRSLEIKELLSIRGESRDEEERTPPLTSLDAVYDSPISWTDLNGGAGHEGEYKLRDLTLTAFAEAQTRAEGNQSLLDYDRMIRLRQRDSSTLAKATTRILDDIFVDVSHRRRLTAAGTSLLDDHPPPITQERPIRRFIT